MAFKALRVFGILKTQRIERLTERVESIASGNLDQRAEAPSNDDLRPIADSVNALTAQLRDQIIEIRRAMVE